MLSVRSTHSQIDPSFLTAHPSFNASSSNQAKSGHNQLKHIQQRLRETPLSNKQLDQVIRTELETKLIIMVRFELGKTSPAYQEESAQIIINNWPSLSDSTQALITHFCRKHLESSSICKHYRKALQSILNKVHPCNDSSSQNEISEEMVPNNPEIVEIEEETPPRLQQPNRKQLQWQDELILNSPTRTENLSLAEKINLPFKAEYQKGHKIRLFQNKEWRALKTQIKQEYVNTSWAQFLNGITPEAAQEIIEANMKAALEQFQNNQKLKTKAEKYIEKKTQKSLYALNETGQGVFLRKGTTLSSRVFRAGDQRFYTLVNRVDQDIRAQIKKEQGVDYNGRTLLGEGNSGTVQLAKLYDRGTQHIVAAKSSDDDDFQDNENKMRATLKGNNNTSTWVQTNDYLKRISLGSKKSSPILFMDLHANGDLWGVTKQLSNIRNNTLREKATRTVAKQLIESVSKLHQAKIAHRDIKPENFMLSKDGNILPIDLANATEKEKIKDSFTGTVGFAAPEEMCEIANRDPQLADLFSLGVVLLNVLKAGKLRKNDIVRTANDTILDPESPIPPTERPKIFDTILKELDKKTFTPTELLQVLHTGKQPA